MTARLRLLAFDLGASNGRAMLGSFDGERLSLEEIYRFANGPVRVGDSLHTDVLYLWAELLRGLEKAAALSSGELASVGVDAWGVDFALLDRGQRLLGNPYHYRDTHTQGTLAEALKKVSRSDIYTQTGNQLIEFNTLFQLLALQRDADPSLDAAHSLLMLPDLIHFWLCGELASEYTIATTSQCYNPVRGDWAWELLERLDLPRHIFQPVLPAGTQLGMLHPWISEQSGCPQLPVILPASHDTGSAVAAVPLSEPDSMYISSGTWSLIGVELPQPLITPQTLAANLANEGGVGGRTRLLKITPGMWLLQECRGEWARHGRDFSYAELTAMAAAAPPFGPLVDVNAADFLAPGDMSGRIQDFCLRTGQAEPLTCAEIVRCILESLALEYNERLLELESLLDKRLNAIHIIGGGSRNHLLNQLAADVTGRPVIAGPVEATAAGNLLVQAMGLGQIASLEELRQVMRTSFELERFEPHPDERWGEAVARYRALAKSKEN